MKIASESPRRLAPLFAVAVFAVLSQPAVADNSAMPGGPWQQTCEDASIRGGMLYARCRQDNGRLSATRKEAGKSNRTNITPQQCPSYRAGNSNGKLVCESQGNVASRWEGSFQRSCRDVSMNSAGTLTATCQSSTGNWQRSSLAPGSCNSYRAGNNNGRLVCESQGNVASRWEGSFQRSCRDISTDSSGSLAATCQTMDGDWQRTSLGARQCNSARAGNSNGQLVCES